MRDGFQRIRAARPHPISPQSPFQRKENSSTRLIGADLTVLLEELTEAIKRGDAFVELGCGV
jgi:hypothetical protein